MGGACSTHAIGETRIHSFDRETYRKVNTLNIRIIGLLIQINIEEECVRALT
jgi:hypothetical protein